MCFRRQERGLVTMTTTEDLPDGTGSVVLVLKIICSVGVYPPVPSLVSLFYEPSEITKANRKPTVIPLTRF